jgi:MFS family permease
LAALSLTSIYLLRALGSDAASAGFTVGVMMLIGVVVNPLAAWLSPGRKRLPMLAASLLISGSIIWMIPWLSARWIMPVLCLFQAFHLGSYAMSDAAMLERVAPARRGRMAVLFLNVAGTGASTSPWIMGFWTDSFGPRATANSSYVLPYFALALMMVFAVLSIPLIARLGEAHEGEMSPAAEIEPATMESVM